MSRLVKCHKDVGEAHAEAVGSGNGDGHPDTPFPTDAEPVRSSGFSASPRRREHRRREPSLSLATVAHVEAAVARCLATDFTPDPVLPSSVSRFVSIAASLQKRHGLLIQAAVVEALASARHLTAWAPEAVAIDDELDRRALMGQLDPLVPVPVTALSPGRRRLRFDAFVVDHRSSTATWLEIKRGMGWMGAAQRAAVQRDLAVGSATALAYARTQGHDPRTGRARLLAYHGVSATEVDPRLVLTRHDLLADFGVDVAGYVDRATSLFSERIGRALPGLIDALDANRAEAAAGGRGSTAGAVARTPCL